MSGCDAAVIGRAGAVVLCTFCVVVVLMSIRMPFIPQVDDAVQNGIVVVGRRFCGILESSREAIVLAVAVVVVFATFAMIAVWDDRRSLPDFIARNPPTVESDITKSTASFWVRTKSSLSIMGSVLFVALFLSRFQH